MLSLWQSIIGRSCHKYHFCRDKSFAEGTTIQGTADSRVRSAEIAEKRDTYRPCAEAEALWRCYTTETEEEKWEGEERDEEEEGGDTCSEIGSIKARPQQKQGHLGQQQYWEVNNIRLEMEMQTWQGTQ